MSSNPHPFATSTLAGWRIRDLIADVDRQHQAQLSRPGGRCPIQAPSPEGHVVKEVNGIARLKGQVMAQGASCASVTGSRRAMARALVGGAFAGVAGRLGLVEESSAKRKRKKRTTARRMEHPEGTVVMETPHPESRK